MNEETHGEDVRHAASTVARILQSRPSALLFDFDGTLSELTNEPDSATILPRSERVLHQLSNHVDIVGIVTGRAAHDVMTKLDASDLVIVGNHGLETYIHGEHIEHDAGVQAKDAIDAAMAEIRQRLERDKLIEGVLFENKRLSASIHYRQAPNQKQVGSVLVPLARRVAGEHGLRLTEGKLIVELRPMADISKGTAVTFMVDEFDLKSAVFLGDDLTDVDGFIGLQTIRESGRIEASAVGVIGPDSHPKVAQTADLLLTGVDGVADFLEALLQELEGNQDNG